MLAVTRNDALCSFHQPKSDCPARMLDRRRGEILAHKHAATQQVCRVQGLQHHVGVGDGRFGVAAPVTGRTGISARAAWPNLEQTAVHVGDGAPPAPTVWMSSIGALIG